MKPNAQMLSYLERCADAFSDGTGFSLADAVVEPIFRNHPNNQREEEVLLKVAVLNTLYAAGVLGVYRMAHHLVLKRSRLLDKYLRSGNPEAVTIVRRGHGIRTKNGKERDFYSFATKYCHWHRPDAYPMYDSYVEVSLDRLAGFLKLDRLMQDLDQRRFSEFKRLVDEVRKRVGWRRSGYKHFDQALWVLGQVLEGDAEPRLRKAVGPPPKGL